VHLEPCYNICEQVEFIAVMSTTKSSTRFSRMTVLSLMALALNGVKLSRTSSSVRTDYQGESHITADVEAEPEQGFHSTVRW
jgi:hypothetical protein